ncbi:MAG: adenosylhomocysteinase [Bryobacterales bacterium]|nr:adenosylhomocysteinase [Bryobacterales bacterium]
MASNAAVPAPQEPRDPALAASGKRHIEWAFQSMPVLRSIRKQLIKSQSLAGMRIAACLHATTETANLMITLRDGGASPILCPVSQESLHKDVAASLEQDYGIPVIPAAAAVQIAPQILLDSGGQLADVWKQYPGSGVIGGTESNSNGVVRLKGMAKSGALRYPVIAVNDAMTKHLFDNRYGTGQSTMDGILRATNILLAGMNVVIAGYGWCGRGVASRARGMGANVIVCEVDPIKALEALMDGYRVMSMNDAAAIGDVFVTVTGNRAVIHRDHFDKLKNGAILCNSGHFNVEIDLDALARVSSGKRQTREFVEEYSMRDGRKIYVLGEGRLINLSSAEGHPAAVMDMSFANQALSVEYLVKNHSSLDRKVYAVPEHLDRQVARLKLEAMGIIIDRLSVEQENYLSSWSEEA